MQKKTARQESERSSCAVLPIALQHHKRQASISPLIGPGRAPEPRFSNQGFEKSQHEEECSSSNARQCKYRAQNQSTAFAKLLERKMADNAGFSKASARLRDQLSLRPRQVSKPYDSCRGSTPSFFMREISVVRLSPIRAAAPSVPATRPLVAFRIRKISSRSPDARIPDGGTTLPFVSSPTATWRAVP